MDEPAPPAGKSSREIIIGQAYQVFRQQGYYHTTMADIGQACGLLKGSIYHHFASKEELMEQVLEMAYGLFKQEVFQLAADADVPARKRLERVLAALDAFYFEELGGCVMALTGLETANRIPAFTRIIRQFFTEWIESFTALFAGSYDPEKARQLGQYTVQEIEGAIMLACIFGDKQYFTATRQRVLSYLS